MAKPAECPIPNPDGSGGDGQANCAIAGPESRSHHAFQSWTVDDYFIGATSRHFAECSNQSSVGFGGRRHFLGAALAALLIMVGVSFLCAQSDSTGALGGTITGAKGAVPGATVVLTNNATNQTLTMVSGTNGSYRFLAAGPRHVSCDAFPHPDSRPRKSRR